MFSLFTHYYPIISHKISEESQCVGETKNKIQQVYSV